MYKWLDLNLFEFFIYSDSPKNKNDSSILPDFH